MNPLVGLGAATAPECAARIRISFHDVRNAKLVEADEAV
jgi:hypothetical protein